MTQTLWERRRGIENENDKNCQEKNQNTPHLLCQKTQTNNKEETDEKQSKASGKKQSEKKSFKKEQVCPTRERGSTSRSQKGLIEDKERPVDSSSLLIFQSQLGIIVLPFL